MDLGRTLISPESKASLRFLLRWIIISTFAGAVGCFVVAGFRWIVEITQTFLANTGIPHSIWAIIGAIIAGAVVYRIEPDAAGEGMPSYITYLNRYDADFPIGPTIMKLPAAFLTLSTFGCGGVAGPVGRSVSGLLAVVFRKIDRRTAAVCGMAATIGALFHTPIGGGLFAVEIIQKADMRYRDLFPAILSSAVSVWLARLIGWEPLLSIDATVGGVSFSTTGILLVFAGIVGLGGGLYTRLYTITVRLFRRNEGNVLLKVVLGTAVSALILRFVNPALSGTAGAVLQSITSGDGSAVYGIFDVAAPIVMVAMVMMLTRAVTSCLTIGSGMSAGLLGPAMSVGLLFAYAWTQLLGVSPGTSQYFAYLATGFAGVLASTMNVPVAAAIMSLELFGPAFGLPAGLASVVGFQINRHRTIYDFALVGSGKQSYVNPPRDPDE